MPLRILFSLVLLVIAGYYTFIAFQELAFMVRGRLGPGFFPQSIGVMLIALLLYSIVVDLRMHTVDRGSKHARDIVVFTAIAVAYVGLLNLLGGFWATVAFLLVALFTFNRGKPVTNVLVSVLLPIGLFLLFDTWLNAAVPRGIVPFP
jgi:putative tricarboxylic transport membrane protein